MGQKRECTQIRTIGFQQRYKGERITFSTDGAGTTVHPFAKRKNELGELLRHINSLDSITLLFSTELSESQSTIS